MQFRNHFQKNLLYSISCLFRIFQVFHANTIEQQGIPFQQGSKPFIVVIRIKMP